MIILSINFNIEGVADYYVGILQGTELHLTDVPTAALLFNEKQCAQLVHAIQLLKVQGKFDPTKVHDYSAIFEKAGLPPMMPYAMETLMNHIETTAELGENPQIKFVVNEVALVPSKVINY